MILLQKNDTIGLYMYVPSNICDELQGYIKDARLAYTLHCPSSPIQPKRDFIVFYFGLERVEAIYDVIAHALEGLDTLEIER